MRRLAAGLLPLLFLGLCVPAALGGEPTDRVRGAIDRGVAIVLRPDLQGNAKKEMRRELLRKELFPYFNFEEMSRRSLGVNWRGRSPQERQEFVSVFKVLLENSYAGKIEGYKGERFVFGKEVLDLPYAEVRTKIVTSKGEEYSINYRLLQDAGGWRVYDIVIEGVSLVNNYRSQFTELLNRHSFGEMMERLRKTAGTGGSG